MGKLGGMTPYPRRLGGGRPRVQLVLDSLNADMGTAYDATNSESVVYVINMALARAIAVAWGTNERLGNIWTPAHMPSDMLARWEKILGLNPSADLTDAERRVAVQNVFERFGQASHTGHLSSVLEGELGDAFVAVEYIPYASAYIQVPDATYPWGVVDSSPWSSTVARVIVRLQCPTNWTEGQFYDAVGRVGTLLEPVLPVWCAYDWYRAGPVSSAISGGPSAAGFYLDDSHNLDNEIFDV